MTEAQQFETEIVKAAKRYLQKPGVDLNLVFRDEAGQALTYTQAFPDLFEQWSQIQSPWDRRSLIYQGVLDPVAANGLEVWQWAERYIEDRYPQQGIQELEKGGLPPLSDPANYVEYCATYAKASNVLNEYAQAKAWSQQGLECEANHSRCQIQLADALHLEGHHDVAHDLYNTVLETKLLDRVDESGRVQVTVEELLGFDSNILYSPVYALALLKSDPNTTESSWQWAEDEFYWSPYFRCHHAYFLVDQGEGAKAFSKLFNIIKEMPWVKEAALNTQMILEKLDPDGQKGLLAEERQWLNELIDQNQWTGEGMHVLGIKNLTF